MNLKVRMITYLPYFAITYRDYADGYAEKTKMVSGAPLQWLPSLDNWLLITDSVVLFLEIE